jgi:hypothetical protein
MGTAASKKRAMRSKKSGVKSFERTSKNQSIINKLRNELKK